MSDSDKAQVLPASRAISSDVMAQGERSRAHVAVSIVTISKDDAEGLELTVRSALTQTFADYEMIIVRSGTSQSARLPNDPRLVLVDVPARGISAAFNRGASLASGDWISFLNGGDTLVEPDSLQCLMAKRDDGIQMILSFAQVDGRSFTIPRRTLRNGKDSFLYASHQATLFHHSLFARFGLFSGAFRVRMDLDWLARLPPSTAFAFVDRVTVRFDASGVSASSVVRSSVEEVRILWRKPETRWRALEVAFMRLPFRVLRRAWRRTH